MCEIPHLLFVLRLEEGLVITREPLEGLLVCVLAQLASDLVARFMGSRFKEVQAPDSSVLVDAILSRQQCVDTLTILTSANKYPIEGQNPAQPSHDRPWSALTISPTMHPAL